MASGKSTFGKALARELKLDFIDLDFYIEQRWRMRIPEIFREKGEEEFRRMERTMLHEVGEWSDVVISCGGGTPCFYDNIDYMLSQGKVVWLEADLPTTIRRILQAPGKRPSVAGKNADQLRDFITPHLAQRIPYYSRAHHRLPSNQLENAREIADTVKRFLGSMKYDV